MNMYSSPKVHIVYSTQQYNCTSQPDVVQASFELGWDHNAGYERFGDQLCALLDKLHALQAKQREPRGTPSIAPASLLDSALVVPCVRCDMPSQRIGMAGLPKHADRCPKNPKNRRRDSL